MRQVWVFPVSWQQKSIQWQKRSLPSKSETDPRIHWVVISASFSNWHLKCCSVIKVKKIVTHSKWRQLEYFGYFGYGVWGHSSILFSPSSSWIHPAAAVRLLSPYLPASPYHFSSTGGLRLTTTESISLRRCRSCCSTIPLQFRWYWTTAASGDTHTHTHLPVRYDTHLISPASHKTHHHTQQQKSSLHNTVLELKAHIGTLTRASVGKCLYEVQQVYCSLCSPVFCFASQ